MLVYITKCTSTIKLVIYNLSSSNVLISPAVDKIKQASAQSCRNACNEREGQRLHTKSIFYHPRIIQVGLPEASVGVWATRSSLLLLQLLQCSLHALAQPSKFHSLCLKAFQCHLSSLQAIFRFFAQGF